MGGKKRGRRAHRYIEINDMIFGKRWLRKDGVNESTLTRRVERGRGRVIEWGKHFYRRLAGGHKAVDGYRRENWVIISLFRVREKRRMRRLWFVMKHVRGDGHVKDVLKIKFWGGIRVGSVDRYLGLEGDM